MSYRHTLTALLGFLLLLGGSPWGIVAHGQRYASAQLQSIAAKTGVAVPTGEGLHYRAAQWNGLPLSIVVRGGEVVHLGYSLFTPWQRHFLPEAQCNFIERLLLTADLGEFYGKTFSRHLQEERIAFEKGSATALKAFCSDTTFLFQATLVDDKRHVCNWYRGQERVATLSYPADYHLIAGVTLEEAENSLSRHATQHLAAGNQPADLPEGLLQQVGHGPVHVLTGDIYKLPELNSNRYFVKDPEAGFQLLYGEDFPLESMANLCTGPDLETGIELEVVLVKYGYKTETFRIGLRQWVDWCMAEGCRPYFGIISHEGDTAVASLVMHNEELGYIHLMRLTFDTAVIADRQGSVKARLNSYVPMSNVKSLFNENNR